MPLKPDPNPHEMFENTARAICPGEYWQAGLAAMIGVRRDTVRQWSNGHLQLRADHFETLLRLLVKRQAEMKAAEERLRAWLARRPMEGD
jgi:hypothetical protein